MRIAKKTDGKTIDLPGEFEIFRLHKELSAAEFEKISAGLIPGEMEDRWFIYVDRNWLYVHRSWTGFCIYKVSIEKRGDKYILDKTFVNRNKDQYKGTDAQYDISLLSSLVNRLLEI